MAAKKTGITRIIIENATATHPLPWTEIAAKYGLKLNSIYQIATRLRAQGRIPAIPAHDGRSRASVDYVPRSKKGAAEPVPFDILRTPPAEWGEDILAEIDKLPILNPEQRKKLLSAIGMRPSTGVAQAAALGKLEDIDRGAGSQIGPPPPLTDAQRIERLSRLMRAVGPELTAQAQEAAFGRSDSPQSDPNPQDSGPSASASDMA